MRLSTLDSLVEKRRWTEASAPPPPVDIKALENQPEKIIESDNVLALFAEKFNVMIAGEQRNAKMLYLAGTSRLLPKAMHVAVKGVSSGGKSEIRKRVLDFFPPEAVIQFTALSERALLYMPDDLSHKILSMGEAFSGKEHEFQELLLRQLMSENILRYPVVQKVDGALQTINVEKHGPVAFMVTTTRNKLHPENETRMLSLEIDDSESQTRAVLQKIARVEGYGDDRQFIDFQPWHDFQRYLAAGERRVIIPFAKTLGRMITEAKSVRLRRDFRQLLQAIKAHAILHRQHRKRKESGAIIATVNQDYAAIRDLMSDLLATASELKVRNAIAETVAVVAALEERQDENPRLANARTAAVGAGFTVREVMAELKLDRSSAYRRLRAAEDAGLIVNVEERRGRTARYQLSGEQPELEAQQLLPTPDELIVQLEKSSPRPPKSRAHLHRGELND